MWGYGVVSDTTAYHFKAVVCITSLALATSKPKYTIMVNKKPA
jgi:hypothetical protein